MATNNSQIPYLVMVGVVAIIAIAFLALQSSSKIEGASIYKEPRESWDGYDRTCVDSDSDNDYFKAGIVTAGSFQYHDFCQGKVLFQAYCTSSNSVRADGYTCPNGCLNAACIR